MTPAGSSTVAWTPSVNSDQGVPPLTALVVYSVEQEQAVTVVLNLDRPLVIVLPTSRGKTLPFIFTASFLDPGVTILVALFNVLLHDYIKRLKLSKVNHVLLYYVQTQFTPIVTISPDHCGQSDFIAYGHVLSMRL
jgi:hypothetical protein